LAVSQSGFFIGRRFKPSTKRHTEESNAMETLCIQNIINSQPVNAGSVVYAGRFSAAYFAQGLVRYWY